MNKIIKTLAITALFCFPGLPAFPQEVQQEETPAVQPVVEENVNFFFAPNGIPVSCGQAMPEVSNRNAGTRDGLPRFRPCPPGQASSSSWVITS